MFKKLKFQGLNYKDLDRYKEHDLKRDEMKSFYQTFDFLDLIRKWPEIIPRFAKLTSPLKIKGDALIVVTAHPSFSQELFNFSEELKKAIFEKVPELKPVIKRIVYETHENYFRERQIVEAVKTEQAKAKPKLHPQSPQYKLLKAEADKLFGHIEDQELKTLLTSIFIQSNY